MNQAHTALLERITSDDPRASEAVDKLTATLHALESLAGRMLDCIDDEDMRMSFNDELSNEFEFASAQIDALALYFAQLWR